MKKTKIFITGATGNVGKAILGQIDFEKFAVTAAVRSVEKAQTESKRTDLAFAQFDFERQIGFESIENHDIVFLLRPPQIGNVKIIEPFLDKIAEKRIASTVFLSVQGADKKSYIPHSKIEKMITEKGIPHVFLRPGYFMDNLTSTLYDEIVRNKRIYLPAGHLKLNWIDTEDIGAVCIKIFEDYGHFKNQILTLTNSSNHGFAEIVSCINDICTTRLRYISPNLLSYIIYMLRNKQSIGYIGIMLLLHFLPRFEKAPQIQQDMAKILGRSPNQISHFIEKNMLKFQLPR